MPPSLHFILATHNRGPVLVDCLRRTLACGYPASHLAITVIDNASTDDTPTLVAALAKDHPALTLLRQPKNYGPVAKNIAIHTSTADFLILLDDDAYPLPGSIPQMIRHFADDPRLAAAVFDVTLPDGTKEASAYPDVFIGAGTALRNAALKSLPTPGILPPHFFMQAEEYDLSFRLVAAGYSVQRFWDMPLMHLKSPGARIGQRTTRLDVRNNLHLLATYLPDPLCHQFAADWLARYWFMATARDRDQATHSVHSTHKQAFLKGAAQGLAQWNKHRDNEKHLLPPAAIERIFKFNTIRTRLQKAQQQLNLQRIAFADFGKNTLAYYLAAQSLGLPVTAIVDTNLAGTETDPTRDYRGIPILSETDFISTNVHTNVDALLLTTLSPVHAHRRAGALRRTLPLPVLDLFSLRPNVPNALLPSR